jgi:hypothetical protein
MGKFSIFQFPRLRADMLLVTAATGDDGDPGD